MLDQDTIDQLKCLLAFKYSKEWIPLSKLEIYLEMDKRKIHKILEWLNETFFLFNKKKNSIIVSKRYGVKIIEIDSDIYLDVSQKIINSSILYTLWKDIIWQRFSGVQSFSFKHLISESSTRRLIKMIREDMIQYNIECSKNYMLHGSERNIRYYIYYKLNSINKIMPAKLSSYDFYHSKKILTALSTQFDIHFSELEQQSIELFIDIGQSRNSNKYNLLPDENENMILELAEGVLNDSIVDNLATDIMIEPLELKFLLSYLMSREGFAERFLSIPDLKKLSNNKLVKSYFQFEQEIEVAFPDLQGFIENENIKKYILTCFIFYTLFQMDLAERIVSELDIHFRYRLWNRVQELFNHLNDKYNDDNLLTQGDYLSPRVFLAFLSTDNSLEYEREVNLLLLLEYNAIEKKVISQAITSSLSIMFNLKLEEIPTSGKRYDLIITNRIDYISILSLYKYDQIIFLPKFPDYELLINIGATLQKSLKNKSSL